MTGECLWGPHKGKSLEILDSQKILLAGSVDADFPGLQIVTPQLPVWQRLVRKMQNGHTWRALPEGKFYPGFRESFTLKDERLPEFEMGIGLWVGVQAVLYPLERIKQPGGLRDERYGVDVEITWDTKAGLPVVLISETEVSTSYVLTRWYGFAQTFPGTEVFK